MMFINHVKSMFANSNGQEKLSSSEEKGLQKREVLFAEGNQLSSEDKPEHDGWYRWIDHLISLEPNKTIEELEVEISKLGAEISELEAFVQCNYQKKLKDDMEMDLKLVKCLYQHFNNPEEIIEELKQHTKNKPRKLVNRIKIHIILIKYFAEQMNIEMTKETKEFIEGIEIQKKEKSNTKYPCKTNPESPYATLGEGTDKEAYDNKRKELRKLIIYAKNNFDDDVYARLLIRVNNCIFSNSQHVLNGKNSDLIVNPDDLDYKGNLECFFNKKVSKKTQEAFTHAEKLRDCVKELLKINHGNFDQIFGDIKDLMKPVLKQSDEASNPSVHPLQNPQAKPNAKKVRNISDIFQISKAHYSFESYASGRGMTELSAEEICKMNQYAKDIKKDSEELDKFIKKIEEVRMMLTMALDNLDPEIIKKYVSEGKVKILEKYLDVARQHFKVTADILNDCYALGDGNKFQREGEDLIEKKLKRIEDAENEAQKESEQPQQRAQSADNAPEKGTPTLSTQTTTNKPQGESNVYDNKGFGKEIMSVVGAIAGAIIGATIAYLAGATLPIIAVIAVISAVPGVLIGCGIAEICEKVSGERKNDPEKGILTALSIVLTPKCMSGGDVAKT